MLRYILLLKLALLTSIQLFATDIKFKSYQLEDGLSNSTIKCFYKTENGLMWIGTEQGIDLFNGQGFIPLHQFITDSTHTLQAPVTSITTISELQNNQLWAGTWGDGLFNVNIETGEYRHFWALPELSNSTISDNYINCLTTFENNLYIGSNYCLSVFNSKNQFIHYDFAEILRKGIPDIRAIVPKDEHLLSIFTNSGEIIEFNTHTSTYKRVGEIEGSTNNITKVIRDHQNKYWIGTEYNGLILLNEDYELLQLPKQLASELNQSHISDIICHPKYGTFISSDGGGLYIIDNNNYSVQRLTQTNSKNTLTSNQLESLFLDDDGILWVGYFKAGFSKANYEGDGIRHIYQSDNERQLLPNKNVNGFVKDSNGLLWVATENGISILNQDFKAANRSGIYAEAIKVLEGLPVTSLTANIHSNIIYAGTYNNGLFCINLKNNKIYNYNKYNSKLTSNFIRDVKAANDTLTYVATVDGGLYKFEDQQFTKIKVYHQNQYELLDFFHIEIIDTNHLWLSSAGKGVIKINTSTGSGEMYQSVGSHISYSTCVTVDSAIYIATNKGVYQLNKTLNDFELIKTMPTDINYYGIIEVDSALWLSTSSGLLKYNRISATVENINSINVQGKEFHPGAFYKLNNTQLLFGGTNGFNIINTKKYQSKPKDSFVFISEFKIYNKLVKPLQQYADNLFLPQQINYTKEITIPHHVDLFSIHANVINYKSHGNNGIVYTISDDAKSGKTYTSNGDISFLNIKPGNYKLSIYPINSTNNKPIVDAAKHIMIKKRLPWWQSYWVYIAFFILITITILFIHRMRVKELSKTKLALQKKVTERTATLLSQKERLQQQKLELQQSIEHNKQLESFKESMINMIVHDLKNPLNGIIGLSSLNESEYLEHINSASRQMLCLVENILDVRRYETHSLKLFYQNCDIRQLANEAIDEVRFLLKDSQIEILNLITPMQLSVDKDIMRRVYINLLTNAIKYSSVNGQISLRSILKEQPNEKSLLLSVSDEGRGIPQEYQESIFDLYQQVDTKKSGQANSNGLGLSFCKIAIDEHNGKIWVESDRGKGATFFFEIPYK
ncbi:ATP-binding protein [Carboxylicivirga sp. M1479]|uniref:sensor histidine kinase n=1 Tax=Carboxylicivirga sp. M1479 TaxID=2594476 RepID=UPI00163D954D|nr:ATP-binding protein [Carboxylicivirga sp. M1479]